MVRVIVEIERIGHFRNFFMAEKLHNPNPKLTFTWYKGLRSDVQIFSDVPLFHQAGSEVRHHENAQ